MTDTLPDRLSTDPESPYYDEQVLARNVGIRFKGVEKNNVEEYCVSEGWIRGGGRNRQGPAWKALDDQAQGRGRTLFEGGRIAGAPHPRHSASGRRAFAQLSPTSSPPRGGFVRHRMRIP